MRDLLARKLSLTVVGVAACAAFSLAAAAWTRASFVRFAHQGFTSWPPYLKTFSGPFLIAGGLLLVGLAATCAFAAGYWLVEKASGAKRSAAAPSVEAMMTARRRLESEIDNALSLFQIHAKNSERHSEVLASSNRKLQATNSDHQIRAVVSYLIAENEDMRRKNDAYRDKLERSREQIASLESALSQSRELTSRDSLTSAHSRRHFDAMIDKEVNEARGDGRALSLIIADIDAFKTVNDRFGHPVGDEILRNFADLLISSVKPTSCVARYGGEEFVVLLSHTPAEEAFEVAEDIRRKLEGKKWGVRGGSPIGKVTASFGVAELQSGDSSTHLIERADARLYQAKAAGRNRVVL